MYYGNVLPIANLCGEASGTLRHTMYVLGSELWEDDFSSLRVKEDVWESQLW